MVVDVVVEVVVVVVVVVAADYRNEKRKYQICSGILRFGGIKFSIR